MLTALACLAFAFSSFASNEEAQNFAENFDFEPKTSCTVKVINPEVIQNITTVKDVP
ncbi:hypothetical protein [Paenimyroides tangerinum]|uniref:hypothetical protein n=1 Tax=Paenimyroides tangerinum TaxID=2488728 RepID=UPI001315A343|nr:hypothetical protein [Paenimyroides tangerinum]